VDPAPARDGGDELDHKIDAVLDRVGAFIGFWLRVLLAVGIAAFVVWLVFFSTWAGVLAAPVLSLILVPIQITVAIVLSVLILVAVLLLLNRGSVYWRMPTETGPSFSDYRGTPGVLSFAARVVTVLRGARQLKGAPGGMPGGLLMIGPLGGGKAYLAACIATEAGVPFGYADARRLAALPTSIGSVRLMLLYGRARRLARRFGACLVFIDEVDAIGAAGGPATAVATGAPGAMLDRAPGLLNALLMQMDPPGPGEGSGVRLLRAMGLRGQSEDGPSVLTIGATSVCEGLDPTLFGPGRFDWTVRIEPPDASGRMEILRHYLDRVPHESDLAIDRLAREMTDSTPGAIKRTVNAALLAARGDGRESVTMRDLTLAMSLGGTSPTARPMAALPTSLLIATTSDGKLRELSALLAPLPIRLVTPTTLGATLEVEETGSTYEENARLKATAYVHETGMATLAEDSGLEIDALGGEPGVYSARYKGLPDGPVKNAHVLELLQDVPADRRTCRYVCCIVYIDEQGQEFVFEGRCEGQIATEPRGSGGFGFDPIVFVPEAGATMAELPEEEKNRISHRARAAQQLIAYLAAAPDQAP
jgi:non-canonical purine NTP pyrophosphatase (RdgB/HAM1 family)